MSATGAGGHCKGKKRVIHSGRKKTDVWGCVASGGSFELAPAAVAV